MQDFNDGFSKSRIRVGQETDSFDNPTSSGSTEPLSESDALHFTLEHVDPITGMRFGRTYFLSALVANESDYMKAASSMQTEGGLDKQRDSNTLLLCYLGLVKAFKELSTRIMTSKVSVQ